MKHFGAAYKAGSPEALAFAPYAFAHPTQRRRAHETRKQGMVPRVMAAVRQQNPGEGNSSSLAKLQAPNATVVVTGQQVGAFLGPLYTLHKAATAIAWAKHLEQELGEPVVPVFWLQTEDHDVAEISRWCLYDEGRTSDSVRITSMHADIRGRARASVQHTTFGASIEDQAQTLARWCSDHADADAIREAYRAGASPADAFRALLAHVFVDTPLLIVNPRVPDLAEATLDIHRKVMVGREAIESALTRRQTELEHAGFGVQIPLRPECALSFLHPEGVEGPRFRVTYRHALSSFGLSGHAATFSEAELWAQAADEPLRLSTSALLRPLVQDTLLPTVAYVGGPGELSYLAQTPPLYELLGVSPPLWIPRAQATWLAGRDRDEMRTLGLQPGDVTMAARDLRSRIVAHRAQHTPDTSLPTAEILARSRALRGDLRKRFGELRDLMAQLDPGLRQAVARTLESCERRVDRLTTKATHAVLARDMEATARLERLRTRLAPGGIPQERVHGIALLLRHGRRLQDCAKQLIDHLDPQSVAPLELEL